ncbi:hypothetical protein BC937DRAFT_91064 [Endogone sp. FLAS-F59071]|nr:hypothetical protein BC937DRAFT_91064 [Endogone sp. FLAS-F59071]|eukprot:RUS21908.1 hypothetical protein BC937DRAFT_91064 [Endogone sp. FLAS-F59071]
MQEAAHILQTSKLRGITTHKSQSLTLPKAVVDLGDKEFAPRLSFVAISQKLKAAQELETELKKSSGWRDCK